MNPLSLEPKMKTFIVLSMLVSLALGQPIESPNPEGRIFGGEFADVSDFPYQVSLHLYSKFYCGGAIISEEWVITAAHCVDQKSEQGIAILAGTSYNNRRGVLVQPLKIYMNPNYNNITLDNDVALIKTNKPMVGPNVSEIPIPESDYKVEDGTTAIVSGWGYSNEAYHILGNHLRFATIETVNWDSCNEAYRFFGGIRPMMFCGTTSKGNTCKGDSGGPIVADDVLIGVTSWGSGKCESTKFPGVYTRLADPKIREWIRMTSGL